MSQKVAKGGVVLMPGGTINNMTDTFLTDTLTMLGRTELDPDIKAGACLGALETISYRTGGVTGDEMYAIVKVLTDPRINDETRIKAIEALDTDKCQKSLLSRGAGLLLSATTTPEGQVALIRKMAAGDIATLREDALSCHLTMEAKVEALSHVANTNASVRTVGMFFTTSEEANMATRLLAIMLQEALKDEEDARGRQKARYLEAVIKAVYANCPVTSETLENMPLSVFGAETVPSTEMANLLADRLGQDPTAWQLLFTQAARGGNMSEVLAGIEGALRR